MFTFDNTFARKMQGFYVPWNGARVPEPRMVKFNRALALELGLDADALDSDTGAAIFAGAEAPEGAETLAMAYAGHQFGHYSPRLGDGRALLVGEVIDRNGNRRDIHLKGSGRTPFSRGGDGKAVLGPVLREYLIGEAMFALGIPTTRALAAVTTGELVMRDGPLPGAVLARVASSHLRVGTFQFFAAEGDLEKLRQLADYAIERHYRQVSMREDRYLAFFEAVRDRQAALIARWMHAGFVHGVMNTDNMAISGETIDYGPCAFIDAYDPMAVFSSIDHTGRYAFSRQPRIALWNLARLAESLLPLMGADTNAAADAANASLQAFPEIYQREWLAVMRLKLGLHTARDEDEALAQGLVALMTRHAPDFTLVFRALADALRGEEAKALAMLGREAEADSLPKAEADSLSDDATHWLARWRRRLEAEGADLPARAEAMDRVNPLYIPRNHVVEAALKSAEAGDLAPFERLLSVLISPFEVQPGMDDLAAPPPEGTPRCRTFCGT